MKPTKLLVIFGACIILPFLVLASPSPTSVHSIAYQECHIKATAHEHVFHRCIQKEFTDEILKEAAYTYNGSKCFQCKLYCSKVDEVKNCTVEYAESLKNVSNKANLYVAHFIRDFIDTVVSFLCDNEAEMMSVSTDDESYACLRESRRPCMIESLYRAHANKSLYCDSDHPGNDQFTAELICQYINNLLECMEKNNKSCNRGVQNFVTGLKSKLKNVEPCAKYYIKDGVN